MLSGCALGCGWLNTFFKVVICTILMLIQKIEASWSSFEILVACIYKSMIWLGWDFIYRCGDEEIDSWDLIESGGLILSEMVLLNNYSIKSDGKMEGYDCYIQMDGWDVILVCHLIDYRDSMNRDSFVKVGNKVEFHDF